MKLGILTFHEEYNYGSVLQAYALQAHLRLRGHEPVFLHQHLSRNDERIKGIFAVRSLRTWARFLVAGVLGGGQFAVQLRLLKSWLLVRKWLALTRYRFFEWKDAPKDLGVDRLVVGSDQLWSCQGEQDPTRYLLIGAPSVHAVAYGVSVGVAQIPDRYKKLYLEGFGNFKAISVRESKAIELMRVCGYTGDVVQVVDPTVLVEPTIWKSMTEGERAGRKLVCYLMGEDIPDALGKLCVFAVKEKATVVVYTDHSTWNDATGFSFFTNAFSALALRFRCLRSRVHFQLSATADEFVRDISSASWIVSDSFHALMFSLIFKKNIRVLRPHNDYRGKMFSRIEDACHSYVYGRVVVNNIEDALESLIQDPETRYNIEAIEANRQFSRIWLENALQGDDNGKRNC